MAEAKIVESVREVFARWLADGQSWIGVFENHDLGHYDLGRKVAFPYDMALYDKAELRKTFAPDHAQIGLGWRYILVAKCKTVDEVFNAMGFDEPLEVIREGARR